jgi:hypothetical protein
MSLAIERTHRTRVAGGIVHQEVLRHVLARDAFGLVSEGSHLAVPRGEGTDAAGDVHQRVGAVDGEAPLSRAGDALLVADGVEGLTAGGLPGGRIVDLALLLLGLEDDGLELLAPAHGAGSAPPEGTVVFVDPGREARGPLSSLADGADREVLFTVALLEERDGLVDSLAPDLRCVAQLHPTLRDEGVDRALGAAREDESVQAGPTQPGTAPATLVAVGDGAGERRLGDRRPTTAHVGLRAGQGTVHEAEDVLRGKWIDLRPVLQHVAHAQTPGADVLLGPALRDRAHLDPAAVEIDVGDATAVLCELHG